MYTTEFEANKNLTLVDNSIRELFDEYIASYNAQQSAATHAATIASSSIVWKENTLKFKILSKMAKDVLSIPATSVAAEATFSAGGRVLNQFRSSLNPQIVEALIYTKDWVSWRNGTFASDVDIDANNVGRPSPSLRGAPTSSDQPESRPIGAPILINGSTLDSLPHLNQVAANVGNWDPWPQSKQGDSGIYMLLYADYYATMPHFLQGELDIGAHRSRLAFFFYSFGMTKKIYRYESELDNIANDPTIKAPSTKAPSIKAYDRKRKVGYVKK
ncbi:hypothetical protein POM88_043970 [Heracleum sosnowskyi]|uniref:HAT C-terminal dimerisation domain-containing protein n=1 Tax=Heracleum sosnowskyi TaxID=360622 RepID=A0AAD8H2X5_9APIA|nr:hypothetical protein POM88_043970 [Heracleum sosnowskyi]